MNGASMEVPPVGVAVVGGLATYTSARTPQCRNGAPSIGFVANNRYYCCFSRSHNRSPAHDDESPIFITDGSEKCYFGPAGRCSVK
jgi:hypothetical protein